MARSWDPARDALVTPCEDTECVFCKLGQRLIDTLNETRADTGTELLTLVRVVAATIVANSKPTDRTTMLDALIGQLREDIQLLLLGTKETH